MQSNPFLIYRPSKNDICAQHVVQGREAVARSRKIIDSNPMPNTFAGRKTHEPFPKEGKGRVIDARPLGRESYA